MSETSRKPPPLYPITSYYCSRLFSSAALLQTRCELGDTAFLLWGPSPKTSSFLPQTMKIDKNHFYKTFKIYISGSFTHFRVVLWLQRVLKTIWKPHKSKEHKILHRNYTQFFSQLTKKNFFATKIFFLDFF